MEYLADDKYRILSKTRCSCICYDITNKVKVSAYIKYQTFRNRKHQFLKLLKQLQHIKHPNISYVAELLQVKVRKQSKEYYFVVERLSNQTLNKTLLDLDKQQIITICRQIKQVVGYLASIHLYLPFLELKNIFLDQSKNSLVNIMPFMNTCSQFQFWDPHRLLIQKLHSEEYKYSFDSFLRILYIELLASNNIQINGLQAELQELSYSQRLSLKTIKKLHVTALQIFLKIWQSRNNKELIIQGLQFKTNITQIIQYFNTKPLQSLQIVFYSTFDIYQINYLDLSSLKTLSLKNNSIRDLSPLVYAKLASLVNLDLSGNQLTNVDALMRTQLQLETLNLLITGVYDITFLKYLQTQKLKRFHISSDGFENVIYNNEISLKTQTPIIAIRNCRIDEQFKFNKLLMNVFGVQSLMAHIQFE